MNRKSCVAACFVVGILTFACVREKTPEQASRPESPPASATISTSSPESPPLAAPSRPTGSSTLDARAVVAEFGRRMKNVSTLAPSDVVIEAIRRNYGGLVEPQLLDKWSAAPAGAPGRQVSSPWPDRIDITSNRQPDPDTAEVDGFLVERTSSGESGRVPVSLRLRRTRGGWLIASYVETRGGAAAPNADETQDANAAAAVVRRYYEAIDAGNFARAYDAWGESGPPGQTREEFEHGFTDTASVTVKTGTPSRIGAAAGSRYVDVPVVVTATDTSGRRQRFTGSYTLRRSVVDGATAAQRRWHIYKASIRREATSESP